MVILRLQSPDHPAIKNLFQQADHRSASLYPGLDRSGTSAQHLIAQGARFFAACDKTSGQIVGCGGYVPMLIPMPDHGTEISGMLPSLPAAGQGAGTVEIKRLFVDPLARRQGVARQIMVCIEDNARKSGYQAIYLETGVKSTAAILLYQSLGFVRCVPFGPYQDDENSVFMRKPLVAENTITEAFT
ncbi:GNAT family N-acetyltransferase [Thalassospira sp. MCCC 1A01428]|uniref:GNAT family N-acetyltransferase n=1 Tax=Thalassospira sp. MCCC 1A01428 TaxID=1470575 RepID=UPI00143D0442|nr:GNAT family N-acetyltransferase [Thalassospira sp. MCCC 1A01428]